MSYLDKFEIFRVWFCGTENRGVVVRALLWKAHVPTSDYSQPGDNDLCRSNVSGGFLRPQKPRWVTSCTPFPLFLSLSPDDRADLASSVIIYVGRSSREMVIEFASVERPLTVIRRLVKGREEDRETQTINTILIVLVARTKRGCWRA